MEDDNHHLDERTLVYPVSLSIAPFGPPSRPTDSPSPPPADNERRRHERRRAGSPKPMTAGAPRASVHERMGPRPGAAGHVELRDSISASSEPFPSVAFAPVRVASALVDGIHVSAATVPPPEGAFPMAVAWENEGATSGCKMTLAHACLSITAERESWPMNPPRPLLSRPM